MKIKQKKKLTSSTHKCKQEIEPKKSEFWGGFRFGDEVEKTQIREERESEELRSNAL
ncbi:hypothetical protein BVRB_5g099160 [Beta vulgaris subsp. vulgaris]|nr:hypothetical protein BVRB_5g099160 [Beta vulgaris subsp. vulgaris]